MDPLLDSVALNLLYSCDLREDLRNKNKPPDQRALPQALGFRQKGSDLHF